MKTVSKHLWSKNKCSEFIADNKFGTLTNEILQVNDTNVGTLYYGIGV